MMLREKTARLLEASGRVTPREVLGAYRETRLRPTRKDYADGMGHACGLTAVASANRDASSVLVCNVPDFVHDYLTTRLHDVETVAEHYGHGFILGFDDHDRPKPGDDDHPLVRGCEAWERCGWRDGRRAARFVGRELGFGEGA